MNKYFLPVSPSELKALNISELDIVIITGDAYVDHPSYGVAVIGRYLEHYGFKVGIIAQPDWRSTDDFKKLGRPKLFFGITSGNVDSMIANYTANKKPRSNDDYSPGGKAGMRPDRALIVYSNRVREAYPDMPIVLGGIEASLRRLSHYDYWDDKVRRSVLVDAKADILVYGMGERQILEIAQRLRKDVETRHFASQGVDENRFKETQGIASLQETLSGIRGTAVIHKEISSIKDVVALPSFEEVSADKEKFSQAFLKIYANMNPVSVKALVQKHADRFVVQYPPAVPLNISEMDLIYNLPYVRNWHPVYQAAGGVPGFETVRWSIVSHRGCCGECNFCALYLHQGRIVQRRSHASILSEARILAADPKFGGTITDIGGPTANMYAASCKLWQKNNFCSHRKCLTPQKCENLGLHYEDTLQLYRELRKIPKVRHVFVGSGLRFDLMVDDYAREYLEEICRYHVSGLIKVAPEHCSNEVLRLMNKPGFNVYEKFVELFKRTVAKIGKKSFIVNYFLVSHPGCTLREALNLALYLAKRKVKPEQIQDFIPTPMTVSSCMHYTGKNPFTGKPVYTAKTEKERKTQRALAQYNKPENKPLVMAALKELNSLHVQAKLFNDREYIPQRKEIKYGKNKGRSARHF